MKVGANVNFLENFFNTWRKVQVSRGLVKTKELWSKRKKCGAKDFEKTRSTKDFNYVYVTINIRYIEFFFEFFEIYNG